MVAELTDTPSADDQRYLLQLGTVLSPKTVDRLLDNVALRRLMRHLAEQATLTDPILATEGTAGFEIVNDIVNCVSGNLASSPWLSSTPAFSQPASWLEWVGGPLGLSGFQTRHNRVLAMFDFTIIRTKIVDWSNAS